MKTSVVIWKSYDLVRMAREQLHKAVGVMESEIANEYIKEILTEKCHACGAAVHSVPQPVNVTVDQETQIIFYACSIICMREATRKLQEAE